MAAGDDPATDGHGVGGADEDDRAHAGDRRVEATQPMIFSADETADVGEDDATPVTEEYKAYDNKFTGKILKVKVDVKEMGVGMKAEAAKAGAEAVQKKAMSD